MKFNVLKICLGLVILLVMPALLTAQSQKERADDAFDLLRYQEAIELYQSYLSNHRDEDAQKKLAESYYLTGQYEATERELYIYLEKYNRNGEMMLKYANILIINGNKDAAKLVLADYIKDNAATTEYKRLFQSVNIEIEVPLTYQYLVEKSPFNSEKSDFCPQYYQDEIYYTSLDGGKTDPWTGRSYSNIYRVQQSGSEGSEIKGNLNGKFHNGAMTFVDDQTMIFTRNHSKKGSNNDYNLILSIAKKSGNKWDFEEELPINSRDYSNAYPAYYSKGKYLIFSSNKPGGFGGMDLYKMAYNNGRWGLPENLGSVVNTAKDEVFATIIDDKLFFSSNGYPGFGGLDIYSIPIESLEGDDRIHYPEPFNSNKDDFGIISKDNLETGYFSSNRDGNGAIDYIYSFNKEAINLPPQSISITGKVVDEYTKIPLKETTVTLTNLTDKTEETYITGDDGRFSFTALSGNSYKVEGIKNDIFTTSEKVDDASVDESYYFTLLHNDPRFSLEGYTINNKTKIGESGVNIINFNKSNSKEEKQVSDEAGFFKFQLDQNSDFEISGNKDGYYTSVSEASTKGLDRSTTLYVKLYLSIEEVIIGDTKILGKETFGGYQFDPVYYDLDKANIRPDASLALDKVVDFLRKNPTLQVELGSHTDCRATDNYNQDLSQRRAVSAVEYIVSKGIDRDRISARGYGESKLVNRCSDGVNCSEAEHQENRRTEIKVVGVE